jgi:hypothetical protein
MAINLAALHAESRPKAPPPPKLKICFGCEAPSYKPLCPLCQRHEEMKAAGGARVWQWTEEERIHNEF